MTRIENARREHARDIAWAVMTAMTDDCCRFLAGDGGSLDDFAEMMTDIAAMEQSPYSYRNAIVALAPDDRVAGVCVGYDGARLKKLREVFLDELKRRFGREFDHIVDETVPGEYYIDSLAVRPEYRRQGIASSLIKAMAARAEAAGLPAALLVDLANPSAERLYVGLGFRFEDNKEFAGHLMKHLMLRR